MIVAGAVGNVMEWFDFASYGYFAGVIGHEFFPSTDPVSSLLAAFGVFASGFLARPIGAAFFGHIGDRYSRKVVLRASVLLMGVSTLLMGLLPNYAAIGVAAPVLLTVLRIAQGFSVGGEYTNSVIYLVERAPEGKRGLVGGWTNVGGILGFLLGSGVGAIISGVLDDDQLMNWGWRVPFLFGVSIALVAMLFRSNLQDSDSSDVEDKTLPIVEAVRTEWRTMLRIAGLVMMGNVGFYMMFVYVTTFLSERVGVKTATALEIDTTAMAALLVIVPAAAWLSDKVGRKPVLLTASIGVFVLAVPLFWLIDHDNAALILASQLCFAVLIGLAFGANSATLVEITRAPYRCTTVSVAYNLTLAIFGGTTPIVATWLIEETGEDLVPAAYLMLMALITLITIVPFRETAFDPIDRG